MQVKVFGPEHPTTNRELYNLVRLFLADDNAVDPVAFGEAALSLTKTLWGKATAGPKTRPAWPLMLSRLSAAPKRRPWNVSASFCVLRLFRSTQRTWMPTKRRNFYLHVWTQW
jgi:hypothetical protein